MNRFRYDNWPLWVQIVYGLAFTLLEPALTIVAGPIVLIYLIATRRVGGALS